MKKYLFLAVSAFILAACSFDRELDMPGQESDSSGPQPLILGVGIDQLNVTRAYSDWASGPVKNVWSDGWLVKVNTSDANDATSTKDYITYGTSPYDETASGNADIDGNSTTEASVSITKIGGEAADVVTTAASWFYWKSTSDSKTIKAWSFGNATSWDGTANSGAGAYTDANHSEDFTGNTGVYTLPTTQSTTPAEFLYVHHVLAYANKADYLLFKHQLALVDVVITTQKGADAVTGCTFGQTGSEIPVKGTFAAPAADAIGTFTAVSSGSGITGVVIPKDLGASDDAITKKKYSAVLLPIDYSGKQFIVINYDGAKYIYTGVAADNLSGGKHYTYNVSITGTNLIVNATIQPWTDHGSALGGSAGLE